MIIPSCISSQGYGIGPVCVCVRVCLSVSPLTAEPFDLKTQNGGGIDLDNISDEFEGQGHRSKFKVTRLKNVISEVSDGLSLCIFCHDVMP